MEGKERELSARIGIVQPFAFLEFTVHRIRCLVLRAADRYAYTSCGSTAYYCLFYLKDGQILIDIGNSCPSSACLVRIAGPCPTVPFQLVPAWLSIRVYERANSKPKRGLLAIVVALSLAVAS